MRNVLRKIWQVIRIYYAVCFALSSIVCFVALFFDIEDKIILAVVGLILSLFSFLLFRKSRKYHLIKNTDDVSKDYQQLLIPPIPQETLKSMRKYYTAIQANDDMRIMRDCFSILQTTANFDTFFMRYDLMHQKAYTLLEAEQAKCKCVKALHVHNACETILSNSLKLKVLFLDNSYKHEYNCAMGLKTAKGQYNRMQRYKEKLIEHEDDFFEVSDAYEQTINKVQALLDQLVG